MQFPGRNQRGPDTYPARGEQVSADSGRHGVVDDGNVAWPERVAEARRSWPEARAEDFAKIGKRRYRDRGSGLELVTVRGAPLLAVGQEETRGAACFFVEAGRIVVLRREEFEQPLLGPAGYVYGQQVRGDSRPCRPQDPVTKRLLKTVGGRGLHKTSHPKYGTWTSWEPLPPPAIDQIRPLVPQGQPEVAVSLYGDSGRSEAERRRLC
jgi:hypothetical protein